LGNTAESNGAQTARTNPAQIHPSEPAADDDDRGGKFPMKIRFRHITVKVYRKTQKYPFYRIAYRADGKRVVRNFKRLNLAKAEAGKQARQLAQGNDTAATLTKKDAQSYRFAVRKLAELRAGLDHPACVLSLEDAIIEYVAAKRLLRDTPLGEAVDGFLSTVAIVRRVNLKTAADEFLAERDGRSKAAAFALLESELFDVVVNDLKIPTVDNGLDADKVHGVAVRHYVRELSEGTPIFVFTGHGTFELAKELYEKAPRRDVWATKADIPLTRMFSKTELPQCLAAIQDTQAQLALVESVEISTGSSPLNLGAKQRRVLQLFGRLNNGAHVNVTQLSGAFGDGRFSYHCRRSKGGFIFIRRREDRANQTPC
jgi:hypothetical protein